MKINVLSCPVTIVVDECENLGLSSGSDGNVKSELKGFNTTSELNPRHDVMLLSSVCLED